MARAYGVEAFCYYHYWFAGRRVLERPVDEVTASGEPDFPFCLCWANETWKGPASGAARGRTLIEQTYPGVDDHRRHFDALLPAFSDRRYLRVDGKLLFMIYRPHDLPDAPRTIELWRSLAERNGLPGLYLVCEHQDPAFDPRRLGFDAAMHFPWLPKRREWGWRRPHLKVFKGALERFGRPLILSYDEVTGRLVVPPVEGIRSHVCVMPNFDNSARAGANGFVLRDATPERFRLHVRRALDRAEHEPQEARLLFVRAWNEWAEGNHLEPDRKWGYAYLEVLREELTSAPRI